jgi:hypothetical protein
MEDILSTWYQTTYPECTQEATKTKHSTWTFWTEIEDA